MSANGFNDDIPVERDLPCKLSESELLARGDSMADAELKIEQLKAQRKALNALIATEVERRASLAHIIESGFEVGAVTCKWIKSFDENAWHLVRQDTGETVDTRAMTAADRQLSLIPADPPKPEIDLEPSTPQQHPMVVLREAVGEEIAEDFVDYDGESDDEPEPAKPPAPVTAAKRGNGKRSNGSKKKKSSKSRGRVHA